MLLVGIPPELETQVAAAQAPPAVTPSPHRVKRVLLLSLDGLHALGLANYVKAGPNSSLAQLSQHGITYTNALTSLDDLLTPEIRLTTMARRISKTEAYDDSKVDAILNEINGKDHTGSQRVGVPEVFGMNFQAISVAQKMKGLGYLDGEGTPSAGCWMLSITQIGRWEKLRQD